MASSITPRPVRNGIRSGHFRGGVAAHGVPPALLPLSPRCRLIASRVKTPWWQLVILDALQKQDWSHVAREASWILKGSPSQGGSLGFCCWKSLHVSPILSFLRLVVPHLWCYKTVLDSSNNFLCLNDPCFVHVAQEYLGCVCLLFCSICVI